MYQEAGTFLYRFRFLFASLLTVTFLMLISALVTAIGSGTVLDAGNRQSASAFDAGMSDTPNVVADAVSSVTNGTRRVLLSMGSGMYGACRSITAATVDSSRSIVHGSAVIVGGAWHGTAFVIRGVASSLLFTLRGVGSGVLFALRTPGKIVGSVTSGHTVSAIIQPSSDKPVPIINQTSADVLAHLGAEQRQQIAQWQAAQLAANQGLDGTIVAGDPNHGGYPAALDNARQDSRLDSWGMYNRECVSYAAWKVYQAYGDMPYWGGVGNANEWVRDAQRAGIPTGSTPQARSVAISMSGHYGHAMWVEKVSGTMIYVSQYNYDLHGHYSEMWVSSSQFTYIYFK